MSTMIFVNLPVKDLKRSVEFFTKLGYTFDQRFTDKNATCMVISDTIFAMLLVEPYFKTFTKKAVTDATKSTEVQLALSADSREAVDAWMAKALAAGGTETGKPEDMDFMYSRGFDDLDGHYWQSVYMDMSKFPDA